MAGWLIDGAVLALVLCLCVVGWRRGLLEQVLGLAGLVVGWLAIPTLRPVIQPWLEQEGVSAANAGVVAAFGAFLIVVLLFRIAQTWLPDAIADMAIGRFDKALGAALGALRGAALAWLLVAGATLMQGPLLEHAPAIRPAWEGSEAVAWVAEVDLLSELSALFRR